MHLEIGHNGSYSKLEFVRRDNGAVPPLLMLEGQAGEVPPDMTSGL
jgi:hypothetical protein